MEHDYVILDDNLQAKIQELAEHVPKGHIPRTMTVHLRGELTRKVSGCVCFPDNFGSYILYFICMWEEHITNMHQFF